RRAARAARAARSLSTRNRRTCASNAPSAASRSARGPSSCRSIELDGHWLALHVDADQQKLERCASTRIAPGVYPPGRHVRDHAAPQGLRRGALDLERALALEHVYDLVTGVIVSPVRPTGACLQSRDDQLALVDFGQVGAIEWRFGERRRRRE